MNIQEARQILLLYRPGTADAEDPQMHAAIELAGRDPELGRWFEEHCAFQEGMRAKFRQIEVPAQLRATLLSSNNGNKIVPMPVWYRQPAWLAAAAAIVLFIGLTGAWFALKTPDQFSQFRDRMVSTALREYRMDVVTNDMTQLRQFMAAGGAPADYAVTKGLAKLELTGGGLIHWQSHPVAMVCFNRGDNQMLFLFVMDRAAIKRMPSEAPQVTTVHDLVTVSWSRGDKTYVLAGPPEAEFVKKYL